MSANPGWDKATSPFHEGELAMQERLGVRDKMDRFGRRVVRSYLPEQHRRFHGSLPLVFVGHVDGEGNVWASAIAGEPGFFYSPDPATLRLDARPLPGDPLARSLRPGLDLGMLGIELGTRRRNRVNGHVARVDGAGIEIAVDQAFGNCPQYIQTRRHAFVRPPRMPAPDGAVEEFRVFDERTAALIRGADTFFVASASQAAPAAPGGDSRDRGVAGADVSHRGGRPGFVKLEGNTLTIPDFAGNLHFNTLGNFLVNPRAGLLFIDFATGDVVMLTGTAEVLFDGPEVEAFRGAERAWRFTLESGLRLTDALPLRWELDEFSPNTLITGDWAEAASVLEAEALRDQWRPYRVVRVEDESSEIRSLYLEPNDGRGLLAFEPGQYLTVRVSPPGADKPLVRTYTVSSAPQDPHYRISVKREPAGDSLTGVPGGAVSGYLHDCIAPGDRIEARAPRGAFSLDPAVRRPAVLLAGGVGVTPMMSMARAVAYEGLRTRYRRPLTVFHAAKTTAARAFADEFRALADGSGGALRYVSVVSRPAEASTRDFAAAGHIDAELLRSHLALDDYDWFLCGPPAFMQAVYDAVRSLGVPDRRIFAEAFGPASLERRPDEGAPAPALVPEAEQSLVRFAKSSFEQRWDRGDNTLLELAEDHGLAPEYGCRSGSCGTCAVAVRAGAVTYRTQPGAAVADGQALICCAVPASETVELDL